MSHFRPHRRSLIGLFASLVYIATLEHCVAHQTSMPAKFTGFHGQYNEDRLLSEIFRHTAEGTCLEVGANDGSTFSNTLYFETLNWNCILVEPISECCNEIRKARRALVFECAASESEGHANLYVGSGANDVYSSLSPHNAVGLECIKQVSIRTRTLDSILSEASVSRLEFVTIDVEGHELQALRGFNLIRWRPKIVIVEDNSNLAAADVEQHMRWAGYYRFWRSGVNDWYALSTMSHLSLFVSIVLSGCFTWHGFVKSCLPRQIARALMNFKRSICA